MQHELEGQDQRPTTRSPAGHTLRAGREAQPAEPVAAAPVTPLLHQATDLRGAPGVPLAGGHVVHQLRQLAAANRALRSELSRWYARLNTVLDFSAGATAGDSPRNLEAALLGRYAAALDLTAVLVDRGGHCTEVRVPGSASADMRIDRERLHLRLAAEIGSARQTGRARCLNGPEAERLGVEDAHVLLSPFQADGGAPEVVIAVRARGQPPFSADDQLASQAVLTMGGQVLRNMRMVRRLREVSLEAVGALANAIEARDNYTGGHSQRVAWLAVLTGRALGLSAEDQQVLAWSGRLHDVGKIAIPERILNKPGQLTREEYEQVREHPRLGYQVLCPLSGLQPVLDAVLYHHENHDGSGYPAGLRGGAIPLTARIMHVVDIFDALTSTRAYRRGLRVAEALRVLDAGAGHITDPEVTTAFTGALRDCIRRQPDVFRERFAHVWMPHQATCR